MIAFFVMLFRDLFVGKESARITYDIGFDYTTAVINSLRGPHDDKYDPYVVYTARAIATYSGRKKDFWAYQEGMHDAIANYEREFGAP